MRRRGLLIALIVSLAVNLFVLGGLVGAAMMGFGHHGPHMPSGPARLHAVGRALPPERRDAWDAAVRGAVQTAGPQLREARTLRRQAWSAISADPMEAQAANAALGQARALEGQARAVMDRAVVDFAATLPAADRAKLMQALSRHGPGGHGPGGYGPAGYGPGGYGPGGYGPGGHGPEGHGPWSGGGDGPGGGPDGAPPLPDR